MILVNDNWVRINYLEDISKIIRENYNEELADELDELIPEHTDEEYDELSWKYEEECEKTDQLEELLMELRIENDLI